MFLFVSEEVENIMIFIISKECVSERGTGNGEQGRCGHVWLAAPDILEHGKDRVVVGYWESHYWTAGGGVVGCVVEVVCNGGSVLSYWFVCGSGCGWGGGVVLLPCWMGIVVLWYVW